MIPHREGNRSQQKEIIETRTTPTWLGHFFGYKEYTTQYYGYCTDWHILPDLWGCDTRKCLWLNRLTRFVPRQAVCCYTTGSPQIKQQQTIDNSQSPYTSSFGTDKRMGRSIVHRQ